MQESDIRSASAKRFILMFTYIDNWYIQTDVNLW